MTRTARMPKKKHLDATPWEDLSLQVEGNGTDDDGLHNEPVEGQEQEHVPISGPVIKKKKSKKRVSQDTEEASSSPKKSKKTDNDSELKQDTKKSKKKEMILEAEEKSASSISILNAVEEMTKNNKANKEKDTNLNTVKKELTKKSNHFKSKREEKLERQREARRRRRAKSKGHACFHCRQPGHQAAECPQAIKGGGQGVGVCYKCGSADHTTKDCKTDTTKSENPFPFAKCFICGETGHLSSGCPDNPKGLYPKGGGCNLCGSVEHLKRDCPQVVMATKQKGGAKYNSGMNYNKSSKYFSADAELNSDEETKPTHKPFRRKKTKLVKF